MTDPTTYTADDVEQIQADAAGPTGPMAATISPGVARRLLDAGWRKVAPDIPPEPQERFRVEVTPNVSHRWWVLEGERVAATTDTAHDADVTCALRNLDALYEDQGGIGKALEEAHQALAVHSAAGDVLTRERDEARAEVERLTASSDQWRSLAGIGQDQAQRALGERDEARAEVERLTAELAKLRPRLTAEDVVRADRYIGPQSVADALNAILDAKESADPQDDGPPTEPHDEVRVTHLNVREALGDLIPPPPAIDMVHDLHRAIHGDSWAKPQSPRAVWDELLAHVEGLAAGRCHACMTERPTDTPSSPRPVTAEMVGAALKEIGSYDLTADGCHVLARKLNYALNELIDAVATRPHTETAT